MLTLKVVLLFVTLVLIVVLVKARLQYQREMNQHLDQLATRLKKLSDKRRST